MTRQDIERDDIFQSNVVVLDQVRVAWPALSAMAGELTRDVTRFGTGRRPRGRRASFPKPAVAAHTMRMRLRTFDLKA